MQELGRDHQLTLDWILAEVQHVLQADACIVQEGNWKWSPLTRPSQYQPAWILL